MMPVLPFIEDNPETIQAIVEQTALHGGTFIIPWFGMSLRDRQRAYYYAALDRLFPGLRARYESRFGERYGCAALNAQALERLFRAACAAHGIATAVKRYRPEQTAEQLALF